jgi:hypothetical protein
MHKSVKLITSFAFMIGPVFANEQALIQCPTTIECSENSIQSCQLSNNPYGLWSYPNAGGRVTKGTHFLREVEYYSETNQIFCNYYANRRQISPIVVTQINRQNILFQPFINELTTWEQINSSIVDCVSSNPENCSLEEKPEILLVSHSYLKFYYSNPNSDGVHNYKIFERLSYENLIEICNATNHCMINIGFCDHFGFICEPYGDVDLDISFPQIVRINEIHNDEKRQGACHLQQKEPFNSIDCVN